MRNAGWEARAHAFPLPPGQLHVLQVLSPLSNWLLLLQESFVTLTVRESAGQLKSMLTDLVQLLCVDNFENLYPHGYQFWHR